MQSIPTRRETPFDPTELAIIRSTSFKAPATNPLTPNSHKEDDEVIDLAARLVRRRSVTPNDDGCQALVADLLGDSGFEIEHMRFGDVSNLWAWHGRGEPVMVFAGHTDVVPTGPEEAWKHAPFDAVIDNGFLHGRGAADMKGSVAAMVVAARRFVARHPNHAGTIAFLLTSDEEGPAVDGTARVVERLVARGTRIDYCVVGEPTSEEIAGDVIKNGRRGSCSATIRILGRQGHVAYPQLALNPVPAAARLVLALSEMQWDTGNANFPPTTFQVSNIRGGTGATNVIPGDIEILCNFRFSPESTPDSLQRETERVAAQIDRRSGTRTELHWCVSGTPFETPRGRLLDSCREAIRRVAGIEPRTSTTGGTSDGRFIAPTGAEVIELGPVNKTIHRTDECVRTADLATLARCHQHILELLFGDQATGTDPINTV